MGTGKDGEGEQEEWGQGGVEGDTTWWEGRWKDERGYGNEWGQGGWDETRKGEGGGGGVRGGGHLDDL